jgi:thiopeptide-type bacteriocin biosynthesis protein
MEIFYQRLFGFFKSTKSIRLFQLFKKSGHTALNEWRHQNELPRQVLWAQDDRKLLIDFENELSVETFISLSKNESRIILHENLSSEYLPKVINGKGEYCNHEIIWFYKKQGEATELAALSDKLKLQAHVNKHEVQRDFLPGDKWTYLKIYCGQHTGTKILQNVVQPLVSQFKNAIDKWFFIRYFDTGYHIRFRIRWKQGADNELFLSKMHEWIEQDHLRKDIHKIVLDTYSRELERYDPVIINQVEALFHSNSELILALYKNKLPDRQIKLAAFKYIDSLLNKFQLTIGEQEALIGNLATAFGEEFGIGKPIKKQLSQEFRKLTPEIDRFINANNPLSQLIDRFIALNDQDISVILHHKADGLLSLPLYSILGSVLHMFINRLYATNQRYWEMQIYQLMHRYYRQKYHWSKVKASNKKRSTQPVTSLNIS